MVDQYLSRVCWLRNKHENTKKHTINKISMGHEKQMSYLQIGCYKFNPIFVGINNLAQDIHA